MSDTSYVGNIKSRVVHTSTCHMVDQMKSLHKIYFDDIDSANYEGYAQCPCCIGDDDCGVVELNFE